MEYALASIVLGIVGYAGYVFGQVTRLRIVTWQLLRDYDSLGQWFQAGGDSTEYQVYMRLLEEGAAYAQIDGWESRLSFAPEFRQTMLPALLTRVQTGLNCLRFRHAIPALAVTVAGYWIHPAMPVLCLLAFLLPFGTMPCRKGRDALFVHLGAMIYLLHRWDGLDAESCRRFVGETPLFGPLYRHMKRLSSGIGTEPESGGHDGPQEPDQH